MPLGIGILHSTAVCSLESKIHLFINVSNIAGTKIIHILLGRKAKPNIFKMSLFLGHTLALAVSSLTLVVLCFIPIPPC